MSSTTVMNLDIVKRHSTAQLCLPRKLITLLLLWCDLVQIVDGITDRWDLSLRQFIHQYPSQQRRADAVLHAFFAHAYLTTRGPWCSPPQRRAGHTLRPTATAYENLDLTAPPPRTTRWHCSTAPSGSEQSAPCYLQKKGSKTLLSCAREPEFVEFRQVASVRV